MKVDSAELIRSFWVALATQRGNAPLFASVRNVRLIKSLSGFGEYCTSPPEHW